MELFSKQAPTTILAGAGLSAAAPTCLPGWWALNDAVLQALGDALERVTRRSGFSEGFRSAITQRRDGTPFLKPDLQAQLIEDEIGEAYFRALAHVDSTVVNPAHELLAELARQGRVGAIITTNFDGTIESALDSLGVAYRLYSSPADFEGLTEDLSHLAVVKVHGSSTQPLTMVDTLRQRLHGRPEVLSRWMHQRFVRFPTLGIGFSGEDLQYDPNYLSIRPSVSEGAEFLFLVRKRPPSVPLDTLANAFPNRVLFSYGELPEWLFDSVRSKDIDHRLSITPACSEEDVEQRRAQAQHDLTAGLSEWTSSLNRMEVINAVTALLSSAGQRPAADYLLRRTWARYREPEDCSGPAYVRYLYNHGETLMRGAKFRNPHDRETDFRAWKEAADQDPRQFFFRAVDCGGTEAASAREILCHFLGGAPVSKIGPTMMSLFESLRQAEDPLSLTLIDASFSLAELLELCAMGQAGTHILERAHQSATRLGDEFRRAEAAWRLARNLAFSLDADPANGDRVAALARECTAIAERLDIRESDAGSALARSIAALAARDWEAIAREARRAEDIYAGIEDLYGISFAKRERVRGLIGQGLAGGHIEGADFDALSAWLQRFAAENAPGLRPLIKLELAMLATCFDDELAAQLATDAAEDAKLQKHPYIGDKAEELLRSLRESGAS